MSPRDPKYLLDMLLAAEEGRTSGNPVAPVVNMRHRLAHDYGNVDLDIIWDVIQNDLPPLIEQLRALVPAP